MARVDTSESVVPRIPSVGATRELPVVAVAPVGRVSQAAVTVPATPHDTPFAYRKLGFRLLIDATLTD